MKVIKTTSHPFTRALELFFEKNISKKGENWECPIITSFLAELAEKKNDVIMAHDCTIVRLIVTQWFQQLASSILINVENSL